MRKVPTTTLVLTLIAGVALACSSNSPPPPENTGGSGNTAGSGGSGGSSAAGAPNDGGVAGNQGLDATTKVDYPSGPYGWEKGSVIANLRWYGWTNPQEANYDPDAMKIIQLSDFYDPDGSKNINAIFINASAVWCVVCKGEQSTIKYQKDKWEPKGVAFLETIFEDGSGEPSEKKDLVNWAKIHEVTWNLVLDPGNKLSAMFDVNATPMNAVVDAKTMKIVSIVTGVPDSKWWGNTLGPLTGDTEQ